MALRIIKYFILFLCCVLAQVLIFNHIVLFHVAIPIVFIYFIIRLPISLKLGVLYSIAFFSGLIIDIFSDTPGVNELACTLIAGLRKPIYYAYMAKDDTTSQLIPSVTSMGISDFSKYLITFLAIYCVLVFSIEYFSFANVKEIVILSASSTLITFIILLAIDCLIPSRL